MIGRFAHQARSLIDAIAPATRPSARGASQPAAHQVESRQQSWRADDRRLHVDAFRPAPTAVSASCVCSPTSTPRRSASGASASPSTPSPGTSCHAPSDTPLASPGAQNSARHQVAAQRYDHLMLQLHDGMKADLAHQRDCPQLTRLSARVHLGLLLRPDRPCSDVRPVHDGADLHLPAKYQCNPQASPLAILEATAGAPPDLK